MILLGGFNRIRRLVSFLFLFSLFCFLLYFIVTFLGKCVRNCGGESQLTGGSIIIDTISDLHGVSQNIRDNDGGEDKIGHIINSSKVVIGAVSCRNGSNPDDKVNEQTVVMLKSVLISAKLYKISQLEIHLFLEHMSDEFYFRETIKSFDIPTNSSTNFTAADGDEVKLQVILNVHSALEAIPKMYHNPMIYHPRYRCAWVRFFFPTSLPKVDAIIHLDSDMIITGNIRKFWERFSLMTGEQLIAVGKGNEPHDRNYNHTYKKWFGDIPHPPPKGINAGLLIMNLSRMRAYSWEEKFLRVYQDYSKLVTLTGQRTFSILLYFDQGLLQLLPCQFNFFHRHCDRGFTCTDAGADPYGVQLVHGNGKQMEQGKIFQGIYDQYKEFEILKWTNTDYGRIRTDYIKDFLMTPIRNSFIQGPNPCFGTLSHILFKNMFDNSSNYTLG